MMTEGSRVRTEVVQRVLREVAETGRLNDAKETQRSRRMLNITSDTGQLLYILVCTMRAQRVLEVGTSNGYSTLWLSWAVSTTRGRVDTIESDTYKVVLARDNLDRAGLLQFVTIHEGLAIDVLSQLDGVYDLVFLDADRASYMGYVEPLLELLRPGGLLVTDNVVSHAHELTDFLSTLKTDPRLMSVTVPIGNGEELSFKLHPGQHESSQQSK
jgi:predicted O-methyltransferase YrrM